MREAVSYLGLEYDISAAPGLEMCGLMRNFHHIVEVEAIFGPWQAL